MIKMILFSFISLKFGCSSESLNDKLYSLIINSLPQGDVAAIITIQICKFQTHVGDWYIEYSSEHCHDYLE